MATRMRDSDGDVIGRAVYRPFNPQTPMIIIEDCGTQRNYPKGPTFRVVKVVDEKGVEETHALRHLQCFKALIDDHRKKYDNHKARLKSLLLAVKQRKGADGGSDSKTD